MKKFFLLLLLTSFLIAGCNTPPPAFRQKNQPEPATEPVADSQDQAPDPLLHDNLNQAIEALDAAEKLGIE